MLLRYQDKEKILHGGEAETTNNRMELMAVIIALENLKKPCDISLTTDSKYVITGITNWLDWKKRGWRTKSGKAIKNKDLWQRLADSCKQHNINCHWVKGHSGQKENELVDTLANKGINSRLGKLMGETRNAPNNT